MLTCEQCGSTYSLQEHQALMRDHDSLRCEVCRFTMKSWNSSRWYSATLVRAAEWPKPASN